jgi:hypothetical protein
MPMRSKLRPKMQAKMTEKLGPSEGVVYVDTTLSVPVLYLNVRVTPEQL